MVRIITGINDFATRFPDAAAEWHPELNGDLTPDRISSRSNKEYYWLCSEGHTFKLSADKRSLGQGCYYCSGRRLLVGFNDLKTMFPEDAAEWDPDNNQGNPEDYTYISHYKANWICRDCGHKWNAMIKYKVNSKWNGCRKCAGRNRGYLRKTKGTGKAGAAGDPFSAKDPTGNRKGSQPRMTKIKGSLAELYPEIAAEWHKTLNGHVTPDMIRPRSDIRYYWRCPVCGEPYAASPIHRVAGTSCPDCSKAKAAARRSKPVLQLDPVSGNVIRRFGSIIEAHLETGISDSNISTVCKGKRKLAGGYSWVYESEYEYHLHFNQLEIEEFL